MEHLALSFLMTLFVLAAAYFFQPGSWFIVVSGLMSLVIVENVKKRLMK